MTSSLKLMGKLRMKRKFIILGSIFVLSLILLMPSIPAIQQKTIEDKAYSDFKEGRDVNNIFNYLREQISNLYSTYEIGPLGPGGWLLFWLIDILENIVYLFQNGFILDGIISLSIVIIASVVLSVMAVFLVIIGFIPYVILVTGILIYDLIKDLFKDNTMKLELLYQNKLNIIKEMM